MRGISFDAMTFDAVACAENVVACMNAMKTKGQTAYEYLMLLTSLVIVVFLLLLLVKLVGL